MAIDGIPKKKAPATTSSKMLMLADFMTATGLSYQDASEQEVNGLKLPSVPIVTVVPRAAELRIEQTQPNAVSMNLQII
jgi:hypothetical protein